MPDFVTEGRNLVLSGKAGRGKTHLATAIAYRAIQNGFTALFTTCAALVDDLSSVAANKRSFREALLRYTSPDVRVVDEVGYLTYSHDAASVLFHVVNDRHLKKRSMLFTTNRRTILRTPHPRTTAYGRSPAGAEEQSTPNPDGRVHRDSG